jgi:PBP1b-binding outer membrane lipoprotein LpoB
MAFVRTGTLRVQVGSRHGLLTTFITQRIRMNAVSKNRQGSRLRVATGLAGAIMITGCASTPAPTAQLQAAEQAIAAAQRTDANQHAAAELGAAQARLASANAAVQAEEMESAARLADESRVEADLAAARTASVKARMVNDEIKRSTGTLIDEMQRNEGEPK